MHWVIDGVLARTNRPGRYSSDPSEVRQAHEFDGRKLPCPETLTHPAQTCTQVPKAEVTRWLDDVIDHGAKSVICLLHSEEIGEYYPDCDLLEEYKQRGLNVRNVQVVDHKSPPLTATERDGTRPMLETRDWPCY